MLVSKVLERQRPVAQHTTQSALAWWDSLPAVPADDMIGGWRGAEVPTGHPLDGLLAASRWIGKRFVSADEVYPLIHEDGRGRLYAANPARVPLAAALRLPVPKGGLGTALFAAGRPVHATQRPHTRLRTIEHRGTATAAMLYDQRPICDVFRRVDGDTVLGLMDMKGMDRPYFFTLTRDEGITPSP